MDQEEILKVRLSNQKLVGEKFKSACEAVKWFGGVQSQDFPNAKWGLGQRVANSTDATIEKEYNDGKILRTHVMRPTWHFVTPEDINWMVELTSTRIKRAFSYYNVALGLDPATLEKSGKLIGKHLKGGNFLTRQEIKVILEKEGIKTIPQKLGHIVGWAELDGIICSGPMKGKTFTYALLSERAPQAKSMKREDAIKELTKRYFQSHSPAAVKDFSWWSGLSMADARAGIVVCKLKTEKVEGIEVYFDDTKHEQMTDQVYLLPNYDEYGIAYQNRSHFFNPEDTKHLGVRGNANFQHMIVYRGRIVGTWKRSVGKKSVVVDGLFFKRLIPQQVDSYQQQVELYGKFLGQQVLSHLQFL